MRLNIEKIVGFSPLLLLRTEQSTQVGIQMHNRRSVWSLRRTRLTKLSGLSLNSCALVWAVGFILFWVPLASGQATGVPIYHQSPVTQEETALTNELSQLVRSSEKLLPETVREQLRRTTCQLELMKPAQTKLAAREICERARRSYLRVGWFYLCTQCSQYRLSLGGGYMLTRDGAMAASYHVVTPPHDLREGCLFAADETGKIFLVTEILAANRFSDACILRIKGDNFTPLSLSTNVYPGDTAYCFSDPAGRRGYFSEGIVNRFFRLPERRSPHEPGAPLVAPLRLNVSTDWASGSSGAPVLDECANVIGQVCTISGVGDDTRSGADLPGTARSEIVFHEAVSARDVLKLIKRSN